MRRPRLKDVAELADVSEPTVSRVINGREGVATRTRERVVAALAELGFDAVPLPSRIRAGVVGLVCGDLTNPVFPTLIHHISDLLARQGHLTTVTVVDQYMNPEERCVDEFLDTSVGSVVFLGGRHAEVEGNLDNYRRLLEHDRSIVLVNGRVTDLPAPHIRCDESVGAIKATRHLIQLGHRRIGCLLGSNRYVPTSRFLSGYRRAMAQSGLAEPDGSVVESVFTLEGGRAGGTRLIENGITGVIAGNDLMALGAIHAAQTSGLRIPHEMSVVGYDGTELTALTSPSLTTLRQPFEDMARLISDAVINEMAGGRRFRDHYVFEPELMARGSTGRPAAPSGLALRAASE